MHVNKLVCTVIELTFQAIFTSLNDPSLIHTATVLVKFEQGLNSHCSVSEKIILGLLRG